jgi:myosin regulatory light chain 12
MIDSLLTDRPGQGDSFNPKDRGVNFTMFLTMMGEHLLELDTEAELLEAFECFDEGDVGKVKGDELRRWLSEVGERMDQHEVDLPLCFVSLCR